MARLTLAKVNSAIHARHPMIKLHKGAGYHYFEYDLTVPDGAGERLIFETRSIMEPRTSGQTLEQWVADADSFASDMVRKHADILG